MNARNLLLSAGPVSDTFGSSGLLLARLYAGTTMAVAHGIKKLPPAPEFVEGVGRLGFPLPELFAWAATGAELAGGVCIALGLLTRPAALATAFTMAVAGFLRHADDPFKVKEFAFCYLALAIVFLFVGAGKYSLDARISRPA